VGKLSSRRLLLRKKRYLAGSSHWRTGRVILTEGRAKEGRSGGGKSEATTGFGFRGESRTRWMKTGEA
jgi:hypothetical protein